MIINNSSSFFILLCWWSLSVYIKLTLLNARRITVQKSVSGRFLIIGLVRVENNCNVNMLMNEWIAVIQVLRATCTLCTSNYMMWITYMFYCRWEGQPRRGLERERDRGKKGGIEKKGSFITSIDFFIIIINYFFCAKRCQLYKTSY
jgi:hypothetical protein